MALFETPVVNRDPEALRREGLEKKNAEYAEELALIERKLEKIGQLQKMRSGFGASRAILEAFEGGASPEAALKVKAAEEAVAILEEGQGFAELTQRRRQLKQLIETGKMDLGSVNE